MIIHMPNSYYDDVEIMVDESGNIHLVQFDFTVSLTPEGAHSLEIYLMGVRDAAKRENENNG